MPALSAVVRPYAPGDGDALRVLWAAAGFQRAFVIVERGNLDGLAFWHAQGYEPRDTVQLGKTL